MPPNMPNIGREKVLVEPEQALLVAKTAARIFATRVQTCQHQVALAERARRERFNASWVARLLPFLQKDPDKKVTFEQLMARPIVSWDEGVFELSLFTSLFEQAQDLAQRAEHATQPLSVVRDDWDRMVSWSSIYTKL